MTLLGATIVRLAARVFGDDVASRVFEPLVADWQREWSQQTRPIGRVLVAIHGGWALAVCASTLCVRQSIPRRTDSADLRASVAVGSPFLVVGTALLMLPFADRLEAGDLRLPALLLPSSLALSLPWALVPASMLLAACTSNADAARRRFVLGAIVLTIAAATVLAMGWGVPLANQAFRVGTAQVYVPPGLHELTLPELLTAGRLGSAAELQKRVLIACLWPAALATLGWRLGRHRRVAGATALTRWWALAGLVVSPFVLPIAPISKQSPVVSAVIVASIWLGLATAIRPRTSTRLT